MTPQQAREKAENLFHSGYTCSQAVIGTFCDELGVDFDATLRLAQPFGGGMGRLREVCGTVSGMLMAAGIAQGSSDPQDKAAKTAMYETVQELAAAFRTQNGSIVCRELLGLVPMGQSEDALTSGKAVQHVIQQPESEARTDEYYKKRPCERLAGDAAEIFQKWLDKRNLSSGTFSK